MALRTYEECVAEAAHVLALEYLRIEAEQSAEAERGEAA